MSQGAIARCAKTILAWTAVVALLATGASAWANGRTEHRARGAAAATRHATRRITLTVYVAGGPAPGAFHKIATTVVLRGPGAKTLRIKVPAHSLAVRLPTGRYRSYALYPRAIGFVMKCYAGNGTFVARTGLSVKYICQVP